MKNNTMKKILIISLILLFAAESWTQGITFFHGTFKEAMEKAKNEEKLIFIDAYAKWCGPCKRMASEVFTRDDVGKVFNNVFINLKIDMEEDEAKDIRDKFPVNAYPTFLIVNEKGELVSKQVGGMSPTDFINFGKNSLSKNDFAADYEKEYKNGKKDPEFLAKYVKALNRGGKSSVKVVNDFLITKPNIKDTSVLKIITEGLFESDSKCFTLFLENRAAIESKIGKDIYLSKIETACQRTVDKAIKYKSVDLLKESIVLMKKYCPKSALDFEINNSMTYYNVVGDIPEYCKTCKDYVSKIIKNEPDKISALAMKIVENYGIDKTAMKQAEDFAKMAADKSKDLKYKLSYANILYKNGKKSEALSQAEKAQKEAGKKDSNISQQAADLILKIKQG
jgi:thiol-disulfide isomerase/thioredoxin